MDVGSLALQIRVGCGPLNVLLRVVPRPTGVRHGNGDLDTGGHATCERSS